MGKPVIAHPAADLATREALVVEQDRAVVSLNTWMVDAAVAAAQDGRLLQIVTPGDSRLTYPLELLLGEGGSQWIVRSGAASFHEGFTGTPMGWTGTRFSPVDGPIPEPQRSRDPALGGIEVQVMTVHPPAAELDLGASTGAVTRALTGAGPSGWSTTEPVSYPWSRPEITAFCRGRIPAPTSLVVVGGGPESRVVGRLHVEQQAAGVLEKVQLAGPAASAVTPDTIERLVAELAGTVRSMVVGVHPIRVNGIRPSDLSPPVVPFGMLIGSEIVAQRGVGHARRAPAWSVRTPVGRGAVPACWCRFDGSPTPSYAQLAAVLEHFGVRR